MSTFMGISADRPVTGNNRHAALSASNQHTVNLITDVLYEGWSLKLNIYLTTLAFITFIVHCHCIPNHLQEVKN